MKPDIRQSSVLKSSKKDNIVKCDASAPHNFLIGVTIHKASFLKLQNANTFVEVSLDQQWTKHTTTVDNSDAPFFNDYFVFELHEQLAQILKRTLQVAAFRKTCCAKRDECVGEFRVDVQTVWMMTDHAFHKKWVPLNQCSEPSQPVGFVQMDICVMSKGSRPSPATIIIKDYENIEENLLIPSLHRSRTANNIKYCINVFSASLVAAKRSFVRVHFAGIIRETRKVNITKHPEWNEKLVFLGSWPSMCQSIQIEVMTADIVSWTQLSIANLHLEDMCISLEDPNPSFGPSFVNLFHPVNSRIYLGKILIEVTLDEYIEEGKTNFHKVLSIPQLLESDYWKVNTFRVSLQLFGAYHVNCSAPKLKVRLRWAHRMSNEKCYLLRSTGDRDSCRTYITNSNHNDTLIIETELPDMRGKFQFDHEVERILEESTLNLNKITQLAAEPITQCKLTEKTIRQLSKRILDIEHNIPSKQFPDNFTNWDKNRCNKLKMLLISSKTRLEKCLHSISKKHFQPSEVHNAYNETLDILNNFRIYLSSHLQNKWPELIVEFLLADKIRAFYCCDPVRFLYSTTDGVTQGILFGRRHSVPIMPVTCYHTCDSVCGCLFAVADLSLSIAAITDPIIQAEPKPSSATEVFCTANIYLHQALIQTEVAGKFFASNRPVSVLFAMESRVVCSSAVDTGLVSIWNEKVQLSLRRPADGQARPPFILIELLNLKDSRYLTDHHIGRALVSPVVFEKDEMKFDSDEIRESHTVQFEISPMNTSHINGVAPPRWIRLYKDGEFTAEILISIVLQIENSAPDALLVTSIPQSLCPAMKKHKIDATFVGLRNWAQMPNRSLGKFKIQIALGDVLLKSGPSSKPYGTSFNLLDPLRSGYVNLPVNFEYWPSMVITHIDCSGKKEVVVGIGVVTDTQRYYIEDITLSGKHKVKETKIELGPEEQQPLLPVDEAKQRIQFIKDRCRNFKNSFVNSKSVEAPRPKQQHTSRNHTWWTKFYNSFNYSNGIAPAAFKHILRIFDSELENQLEFGQLRDWADCVHLTSRSGPNKQSYADVKLNVQIRNCSESIGLHSLNKAQQLLDLISERPVTVNVYVVQGINLRPHDGVGNSDAYLQVNYGGNKINDRKNFVSNETNPIFGKCYQMKGVLPRDLLLTISVYDRDSMSVMSGDDLIGSTSIDIEDRLRSRHRAFAGIAEEYSQSGYNKWRWAETPSEILQKLCSRHGLAAPVMVGRRLQVGGKTFTDSTKLSMEEPLIERLSLSVLKELHTLPAIGYCLVPEHVETRSLFRSDRPGVEQGKLQLWIEIIDSSRNTSSQPFNLLDITPTPPKRFELRVIVWNTSDVTLDEANMFGKRMSDIYVKGWIDNVQDAQNTDVHYRSLTGEGQFNWRLVFPLLYAEAEDMMVVTRTKGFFETKDTLLKRPACLHIQVWDNDAISADDFLGSASILLSGFEMPAAKADKCRLSEKTSSSKELVNLFTLPSSVRGWFPIKGQIADDGKIGQTGKVELELEVKPSSMCSAVGLGRDGPQALPAPDRPETSFNWFSNPMRSLKYILLPQLKRLCRWICLGFIVVGVLIILVWLIASQALGAAHPSATIFGMSKKSRCARSGSC